MKLLWLTGNFHPETGGIQQYQTEMLRRLRHTVELHLVTSDGQFPPFDGVQHHVCANLGGARGGGAWSRARAQLAQILATVAPDRVHFGDAGVAVHADLLPARVPATATVHGNDFSSPWQLWHDGPVRAAIDLGLGRCERIIAVSRHTAALLRQGGIAGPIEVVYSGCDLARFRPRPIDRAAWLRRHGIASDCALILTVGRLVPRKGHATVLQAMTRLRRPLHWVSIGDGPLRLRLELARWRHGQRRRSTLLPSVSDDELVAWYNACDLFVLAPVSRPSRNGFDSEGYGLVFSEAAACAKPVVASGAAGCREAVADDETGLLVPPGDAAALAAAIERILAQPALAGRLGGEGRRRLLAAGGWERCVDRLQALWTLRPPLRDALEASC
jgi:phosphatidylinositol alpha-1,6-mannosyltransferase